MLPPRKFADEFVAAVLFELRLAGRLRLRSFERLSGSQDDNLQQMSRCDLANKKQIPRGGLVGMTDVSPLTRRPLMDAQSAQTHQSPATVRVRAFLLAQHIAAAEALPMLMPNEPEDGFVS